MWRGFDGMLNCHQEFRSFSILWSDLVGIFLKVDSCRNSWVPPCFTNTGIAVRFVCIKLTMPCHGFVMSYSQFAHCLDIFIFKILLSLQTWADANYTYSGPGCSNVGWRYPPGPGCSNVG